MRVARALRGFCFGLLVIAPLVSAQNNTSAKCARKCQQIQRQIKQIDTKLHWISEQLGYLFDPNSDIVDDISEDGVSYPPDTEPRQTASTPEAPLSTFQTLIIPTHSGYPAINPSLISSTQLPVPTTIMGGGSGYRSVAYFTNWGIYARNYTPDKVPVDKLTHILYAFADNGEDGTVKLTDTWSDIEKHYPDDSWNDVGKNMYGSLKKLNIAKKKNRNLKIMLSIGGWTYTNTVKHFDTPASTSEGRKRFADSCVQMIKDYGFDGIDLDWEYPQNPEQGEQLVMLLQEIRHAMDAYAQTIAGGDTPPHFQLSIAAPAGKSNYQNLPLNRLAAVLDFINLMAYDYSGSWDNATGHQANLYASKSCPQCTPFDSQSVIDAYGAAGVPSNKLVLGMPLYGRAFTNTSGVGATFNGVGYADQEKGSYEAGIWQYNVLPRPGASEYVDEETGASYSYDANSKTLVSYDTVDMARRKAQYIKARNLGGAMWWELSGDRTDDQGSIVTNVVREFGGSNRLEQEPNWLTYPDSQFDNLRQGFPNDS